MTILLIYLLFGIVICGLLFREVFLRKRVGAFSASLAGILLFLIFDGFRFEALNYSAYLTYTASNTISIFQFYFIVTFLLFRNALLRVKRNISSSSLSHNKDFVNPKFLIFFLPLSLVGNFIDTDSGVVYLFVNVARGALFCYVYSAVQNQGKVGLLCLFVIVCLFFSLFFDLSLSSRRGFIVYLWVFLMLMLYLYKDRLRGAYANILMFSFFVLVFLYLNYMRSEHDFGYGFSQGEVFANTINYIITMRSIDTFSNTLFIYNSYGSQFDYLWGYSYLYPLLVLIPRSLWSEKPMAFSTELAFNISTGSAGVTFSNWLDISQYSLSPGLFGELLANFGILGVLISPFIVASLVVKVDRASFSAQGPINLIWVFFIPAIFLLFRGDFFSATAFSIYPVIGIMLYKVISRVHFR